MISCYRSFRTAEVLRSNAGDFEFNLEEDTSKKRTANFNILLVDLSEAEIDHAKSSVFKFTHGQSLYGEYYEFKSPDGGIIYIC